jgi:hypothetical protein
VCVLDYSYGSSLQQCNAIERRIYEHCWSSNAVCPIAPKFTYYNLCLSLATLDLLMFQPRAPVQLSSPILSLTTHGYLDLSPRF